MRTFELFTLGLILSGMSFISCKNTGKDVSEASKVMHAEIGNESTCAQLYTFKVNAKDWIRPSSTDRFVKVSIPAITSDIINNGTVIIYMSEAGRDIVLPFTYYQVRQAMSFQPSYELGFIYVNILGNFILNNSVHYTFKVIVVNNKGFLLFKNKEWNDLKEIQKLMKLNINQK